MTEEETLAALWEIVQKVAAEDTMYSDAFLDMFCMFCRREEKYEHDPSCIVLKARALVAQNSPQSH